MDDDDGWRYVISSKNRYIKGDIPTWGKYINNRNLNSKINEIKPSNVDPSKIIDNINSLLSSIKSSRFYTVLIENLQKFSIKNFKIIILGCASPTYGPFITNCKYQWALIKSLIDDYLYKITSIEIYDPIMSDIDYHIWDKLIQFPRCNKTSDWTLLVMPHCELELYRTVFESLSHKIDIIKSARELANGEYEFRDISNIENVILISNTIKNCIGLNLDNIVEIKLPKFDLYPNAFNDLYLVKIIS